jgi:hypothetical protein
VLKVRSGYRPHTVALAAATLYTRDRRATPHAATSNWPPVAGVVSAERYAMRTGGGLRRGTLRWLTAAYGWIPCFVQGDVSGLAEP